MKNKPAKELSVIQKAHDLILWYVPLLNRLPRDQKLISPLPKMKRSAGALALKHLFLVREAD